ncbi:transcription factor CPC [Artemisia annua]|uniref:Transcription factor CPC n=1 Tax=Artemisia annua TaxID=35608 RepID=A0A2U1L882_ARTAN|nr:transcription factor CPC [Artemisia annua]
MANLDKYTTNNVSTHIKDSSNQESRVHFTEDEKTLITRMYNLVGERWSLIAGRIPGRSAEEIEKYWTSKNQK